MTDTSSNPHKMLINGEWTDSSGSETDQVVNPATGRVIASVPRATKTDVDRAVAAARSAFEGWLHTTPAERSYHLLKMADIADENAELLGRIESENTGKPLPQAIYQVSYMSDVIRFMAGAARNLEGLSAGEYMSGYTSYMRREPIGVAAGIVPWNYPMVMAAWKFAPAIAAGNVHIVKPSELTPLSLLKYAELTQEVLPPGVLQIVTGDASVGRALVEHQDVDFVSVTGDVSTGRSVASVAGQGLKRTHLELGGNAPILIFDDADWDNARDVLRVGPYLNSGQDCTASSRILVASNMYDTVVSDMVDIARSLKIGDPAKDLDLDLGPVISKRQQERVLGLLSRAQQNGAKILTGGESLSPETAFVTPAVVTGVAQTDEIVQSEIFGPVVTIQSFDSDEQGYAWANDTRRRLSATVFTENHTRAMEATKLLRFGMVWVNDTWAGSSEFPHGGFGDSGYGKDMSKYGFEEYTQLKNVTHRSGRGRSYWADGFLADIEAIKGSLGN